jgi:hypothetical protein
MGNPCQGVLLDKKDPNVAGLGRVEIQRGDYVLQQALFNMGNPGQGVLLYKKDPNVAGLE